MYGTVTISRKEYTKLIEAEAMLDALLAAGVDNWEGFNDAMEDYTDSAAKL